MWTVIHLADISECDEEETDLKAIQAISFDVSSSLRNSAEYFAKEYIKLVSELSRWDKLVVIEHGDCQPNKVTTFKLVPPKKEWTVKEDK